MRSFKATSGWVTHGMAAAVVAAALGVSGDARAERPAGYYVSGAAAGQLLDDPDLDGTGIATNAETDFGYGGGAAIGYGYNNGLRAELEATYLTGDVGNIGATSGEGSIDAISFMLNGLYDFDLGSGFTPYIGAGAGGMRLSYDGLSPVGTSSIDDDVYVPAVQGIAGVSYALTEEVSLFTDYRYVHGFEPEFTTANGVNVDGEYSSHTLLVGFRFRFGGDLSGDAKAEAPMAIAEPAKAPPPEPEPKPEPEPAKIPEPQPEQAAAPPEPEPEPKPVIQRSFLVFFDWDKSSMTREAQMIVDAAAKNASDGGVTRIMATGHADRSGPASYNLRLSRKRAMVVRDELVKRGVPANQIEITWKGETNPLVPTRDGVREPKNRRVQIVLPNGATASN